MSAAELAELSGRVFGHSPGAVRRLADALGVPYDGVRHVLAGRRAVPRAWGPAIEALRARQEAERTIPPPPDGERRSARIVRVEAQDALWPALDRLARDAQEVGWSPSEIEQAVMAWGAMRYLRASGRG
jgi:hypothetical protein